MCKAFSCIVDVSKKVTWKLGVDSHSELVTLGGYKDDTANRAELTFAKIEITPRNSNYLGPDEWALTVDETVRPAWFSQQHEEVCWAAHKKWLAKLDKVLVRKPIVHPFKLKPPAIGKKQIALLKEWDSVGDSVRDSVWDSVGASVGASVWDSVRDSVRDSVWDSVWASVGASVRASVWASVGASVRAYIGSFFVLPRKAWKYTDNIKTKGYPFQSAVDLWEMGLVPSFDGKIWRLHGHGDGRVVFSSSAEDLRK